VLWLLAAIGGAIGVAVNYVSRSWLSLAALVFLVGMGMLATYLSGVRVYELNDEQVRERRLTPIVIEFMYKRRVAEVLLDFCLVAISYYAAYKLRFEDPEDFMRNFANFSRSLPVVLAAQLVAFFIVGVYRGMWRHFGMTDTIVVAKGVFVGVVSAQLVILYIYRFFSYSRTVFVIYGVLVLMAVTLSRASFRIVGEYIQRKRNAGRRVVVYGAGDGGTLVMRQLQSGAEAVRLLGFIDDDPRQSGIRVHGLPVLGTFDSLVDLLRQGGVDQVVISDNQLDAGRLADLRELCSRHGVALTRLLVGLEDLVVVAADTPPGRSHLRQVER
jgi:UDP-GlcNAc:undecaprenyl-phosphate/decaprenyl-phosphate GlcNAc-1-phosphate transferase